jgi:hypothetical protein
MGKEYRMKMVKSIVIIMFLFFSFEIIYSNPIMEFFLNELLLDRNNNTNWTLEIRNQRGMNFDGGYLTTLNDTAYFKPGIVWNKEFVLITNDSLLKPLSINPNGDVLKIYANDDNRYDEIHFGDIEGTYISTPKPEQSICLREYFDDHWQRYYYYLDQSPTFSNENDSVKAIGNIEGYVTDEFDKPLEGIKIIYDYEELLEVYYDIYVLTDSSGYFIVRDYARITDLTFKKDNCQTKNLSLQIWPDSTVTISVIMQDTLSAIDESPDYIRKDFEISQNYPNPFNSKTTITYALPLSDFVEITIFDMAGKQIDKLFNGYQNAGQQRLIWNAESFASGVYIYQVRTSQTVINKKCLLVR